MHNGVIAPKSTAGDNTIQREAQFPQDRGRVALGNYQLAEGALGHDDALRLYNFNDHFRGEAPDRGAIESGDERPHYGVVLWQQSRL